MRPLIGVTGSFGTAGHDKHPNNRVMVGRHYLEAIVEAGGVPVIVPPQAQADELADRLDGWLLPGGDDLDTTRYGVPVHPKATLEDPRRVAFEESLFEAWPESKPVLGICYGCQLINVIRGGRIEQHIPDRDGTVEHSGGVLQNYRIERGLLAEALGTAVPQGKSYHHQACAEIGDGLKAVAWHEDGTVEGWEDVTGRWMLGVQWHPERTQDSQETRSLFRAFVEACRS